MMSGTKTPRHAVTIDARRFFFISPISVSMPAENIKKATPSSAVSSKKVPVGPDPETVIMLNTLGPNSIPAKRYPTTSGKPSFRIMSPQTFVDNKIIASHKKNV